MLKNYIIIAWRNIGKNKLYTLLNITGLSVGIAFTLLMASYVWSELQVNSRLRNVDQQYLISSKWKDPDMGIDFTTVAQLPQALKENYPHLVANYYHWDGVTSIVSKGGAQFRESIQLGDSTLINMYGLKLLYGTPRALDEPFTAVITTATANKYFGSTNVVGQTLTIQNFSGTKHDFTVTAVLADQPRNSITNFTEDNNVGIFIPTSATKFMGRVMDGWNNAYIVGNLELRPGVKPEDLDAPMRQLIRSNAPEQIARNLTPYLRPLKTYYLEANNGLVKEMLFTLSAVAFFILIMAAINFINLCISQSAGRVKEMGIRKVLGGIKKQLIYQFLTESVIMTLLATAVALMLYAAARPYISQTVGMPISSLFAFPLWYWVIPVALALIIGLLTGIYPALVLSSLNAIDSIKGKIIGVKGSALLRKVLVSFQFGLAAVALITAIVVSGQIDLFFSKRLGYDKEHVVYAQAPRNWSQEGVQKMESIRQQLAQVPGVSNVTLSWEIPNGANAGTLSIYKTGGDPSVAIPTQQMATDAHYTSTYNISLKAGRFFNDLYTQADSNNVVINEANAKALGFKSAEQAIGAQLHTPGSTDVLNVIGVTADFHLGSMQKQIQPITFLNVNNIHLYRYLSFKLRPGDTERTLAALQTKWKTLMPDAPFEYNFMDTALEKLYRTEIQLKQASFIATTLAIVISFLGVLGLISQSVQQRTKEIGIRKVLGSSVRAIMGLFVKDFLKTVLLSGLIACPIAYLLMQKWLADYAYRIHITFVPFVVSIGLLTLLTIMLIGLQTLKAALDTPVRSLRNE
ncbi:ABC transporter permease [Mucilaginibacter daejeonensis]|uniref:ABC transporter permease n=1 Tax=Mucilaginibacter daejeonensis TaxID=398049 RepID=UPI001D175F25|nr:ABC transporter permease [Mucilaginibacter daejeonensis]UEG54485.1 ABC transporter permease [Mucilaginibacter daejeonensis]